MENKEPAQQGMLSNSAYDLMEQLTKENQSLWRIRNNYKKDSAEDQEAMEFWNYLEKDKAEHIKRLTELVEKRLRAK